MRQLLTLALAITFAMAFGGVANGAIEVLNNGDFEAGGTGWTASNVLFTGSYDMPGNEQGPVTAYQGSKMAVLSGINPSIDASLGQETNLHLSTSDAEVSFWMQLEADDESVTGMLAEMFTDESDYLNVFVGSNLVYSEGLDDLYFTFFGIGPLFGESAQTGWQEVSFTVPKADLMTGAEITFLFATENLPDVFGPQDFVAYVDDVSVQVDGLVPEPASLAVWGSLAGLGLVGAFWRRRRK